MSKKLWCQDLYFVMTSTSKSWILAKIFTLLPLCVWFATQPKLAASLRVKTVGCFVVFAHNHVDIDLSGGCGCLDPVTSITGSVRNIGCCDSAKASCISSC